MTSVFGGASRRSIFIPSIYDSPQSPGLSLRSPSPCEPQNRADFESAPWDRTGRRKDSRQGQSFQGSVRTCCGICSGESRSAGAPAAWKVLPRCVAGFHPLLRIQTVGGRSASRHRCRAAGSRCWRLGSWGSGIAHATTSSARCAGPEAFGARSLLGRCWVSAGVQAGLRPGMGRGRLSLLP